MLMLVMKIIYFEQEPFDVVFFPAKVVKRYEDSQKAADMHRVSGLKQLY